MELSIIPPSPNWYQTDIMACAPDNTLLYGSSRDLVVIKPKKQDKSFANQSQHNVNIVSPAHAQRIICVNVNRHWGAPHKYAVTTSETDKIIKVWDVEHLEKKFSHSKHAQDDDAIVGAAFSGDDRVVSVIESGKVIVWNIVKDETTTLDSLFIKMVGKKASITCFSVCPHTSWLLAVGMKNGLIVVLDIRRSGASLYTLRGHGSKVLSLSWCPAPVNIFPKLPNNKVIERRDKSNDPLTKDAKVEVPHIPGTNSEKVCETVAEAVKVESNGQLTKDDSLAKVEVPHISGTDSENVCETVAEAVKVESNGQLTTDDSLAKVEVPHISGTNSEKVCETVAEAVKVESNGQLTKDDSLAKVEASHISGVNSGKVCETVAEAPKVERNDQLTKDDSLAKVEVLHIPGTNSGNISETLAEAVKVESNGQLTKDDSLVKDEVSHISGVNSGKVCETLTEAQRVGEECGFVQPHNQIQIINQTSEKRLDSNEDLQSPPETRLISFNDPVGLTSTTSTPLANNLSEVNSFFKEKVQCNMSPLSEQVVGDPDTSTDRRVMSMDLTLCDMPEKPIINLKNSAQVESTTSPNEQVETNEPAISNELKCESERTLETLDSSTSDNVVNWRTKPASVVCVEEQPRKEFLLASSAQEDQIYIWRAGTDGRMQTLLNPALPKRYKVPKNTGSSWVTVCWISPNVLLSSTKNAELLQWTLPKPLDQQKNFKKIHSLHYKAVLSIKAPITYCNEYNFLQSTPLTPWTIGIEGLVLNYDLETLKPKIVQRTTGGSVNCCAGSPMDPYRLAFGTGQREIQIWNLSKLNETYSPDVYYKDILGAVTALSWHGQKEGWLAWGTVEGRIGIIDVNKGKSSKVLPHYFKSQIHKLEWGLGTSSDGEQKLFVVSEGKLAIFVPESKDGPHILQIPDESSVYSMSWKPDFSYLLAVSRTGKIYKYTVNSLDDSLNLEDVFYIPLKLESIIWHPNAEQSADVDGYSQMFASVEKFCNVCIVNLAIESDDFEDKVVTKFTNHQDTKINDIKWNPYVLHHLIILDDSGVAQIFDIKAKTVIHTFINQWLDPLLCLYWAPSSSEDAFQLIMGTQNRKMLFFNKFEYPPLSSADIESKVKPIRRVLAKESQTKGAKAEPKEPNKIKTQRKSPVVPYFYTTEEQELFADMKKLLIWKLSGHKETTNNKTSDVSILDVFGNDKDLDNVYEFNYKKLYKDRKYSQINMLSLFEGDVSTAFKQAIQQKRVNPWIISMAPLVSPMLWKSAYEVYAMQLMDEPDSDPMQIVSLMLACHKVEESVQFLCEKHLFREGFLLAKTRCGANSALVSDTLAKWANHCFHQGNYEFAACCYISSGNYSAAAEVLNRRNSVPMLQMSAHLAALSQNEDLLKAIEVKLCKLTDSNDETHESSKMQSDLAAIIQKYLTFNTELCPRPANNSSLLEETKPVLHIDGETPELDPSLKTNAQLHFSHEQEENMKYLQNFKQLSFPLTESDQAQAPKQNMTLNEALGNQLGVECPISSMSSALYEEHEAGEIQLTKTVNSPLYIGCDNTCKELNGDVLQLASVCHANTFTTEKDNNIYEDHVEDAERKSHICKGGQSLVELDDSGAKQDANMA